MAKVIAGRVKISELVHGQRRNAYLCPLSLALKRVTNNKYQFLTGSKAVLLVTKSENRTMTYTAVMSKALYEWVHKFDEKPTAKTIGFRLTFKFNRGNVSKKFTG